MLQQSVGCELNGSCPANEDIRQLCLLGQGVSVATGTENGVLWRYGEDGGAVLCERIHKMCVITLNRINKPHGNEIW